jgi:hypothetical protein
MTERDSVAAKHAKEQTAMDFENSFHGLDVGTSGPLKLSPMLHKMVGMER